MLRRANTAAIARASFFIIEVTFTWLTTAYVGRAASREASQREKAADEISRAFGTERKLRDGFLGRQRLETFVPDWNGIYYVALLHALKS